MCFIHKIGFQEIQLDQMLLLKHPSNELIDVSSLYLFIIGRLKCLLQVICLKERLTISVGEKLEKQTL